MGIVFLLILIPLFSIGVVLYITTLYDFFATGNFNELMFLISTILSVVTSYLLPKTFVSIMPAKNAKSLNNRNMILVLSNYISLMLLLLFGVVMLYRGIISVNYVQIIGGIGCVFVFFYATYFYFFSYEKKEFKLEIIIDNKKYKELTFVNKEGTVTFYTEDNKLKEGKKYVLEYNKYTNVVKRINGLILGGGNHEKDN